MSNETQERNELRVPDGHILVHIGPHKTGTTSLQAALYTGRGAMQVQGVHHAGWSRNPARAVQSVTGQTSAWGGTPPSIRAWRGLVRDVHRADPDRVILSSEFLAHAGPDVVRRVVDDLGRERVHVVTTLRPISRILPSMWQQSIKTGRTVPFEAWLRRLFATDKPPAAFWTLQQHDQLIGRWAAAVGVDRVTAVVLDESDRDMVLRTFERLLGLRPETLQPVSGLANRSITAEEAEAIRAYNIAHREAGLGKQVHALVMRFGAAQYLCSLDPLADGTTIRLPAWVLEDVARKAHEIVSGIRASGVRVVGDLDQLLEVPGPPALGQETLPEEVPAEVAARIAMGILVATGRTRSEEAVDDEEIAEVVSAVASRQLLASIALRTRATARRKGNRGLRLLATGVGRAGEMVRSPRAAKPAGPRARPGLASGGATGGAAGDGASPRVALPGGTILVHIGPPKTGTTAVQAAFDEARARAAAQGVHYAGRRRHSIAAVQAMLHRRGIKAETVPPMHLWNRLLGEIHDAAPSRVVLSSEFFADATPDRIQAVVEALGPDRVHVVVTLRPLSRIIPSQWQQYIQSGMRTSYGSWLDAMLNRPPGKLSPSFWHRHRHDELIARWAAVVGPDRVTAIVVDEVDREMVLRQFEQLTGLQQGTLRLQASLQNRSLTAQEVEAVRALNVAFAAAGLRRPLHAEIVNFGATEYLKRVPPEPGLTRVELPAWSAPRVTEISHQIVAGIRDSGVGVIGDLDRLTAVATGDGPRPGDAAVRVPVSVAARLMLGVLYASGAVPETPAPRQPATGHEPRAGRGNHAWRKGRGAAGTRFDPRMTEPIEIARVPTRRIVAILASRGRSSLRARLPKHGS